MNLNPFLSAVLLFLLNFSAYAGGVDDYVKAQMRERHIPGAAIAVARGGNIVKAEGYGLASVEFNVPVTKETVFEIGSVTKQITAAAIMLLVEEGKVNLDEKIHVYLPGAPGKWSNVTVRHLLTHRREKLHRNFVGFELTKDKNVMDCQSHRAYPLESTASAINTATRL